MHVQGFSQLRHVKGEQLAVHTMRQRLETNRSVAKLSQPKVNHSRFLQGLDSCSTAPPPLCPCPPTLCSSFCNPSPSQLPFSNTGSSKLPFWTVCLKEELPFPFPAWELALRVACTRVLRMWVTSLSVCAFVFLSSQEPGHFFTPARTVTLLLSLKNACKTQIHPPPATLRIAPLPDPSNYSASLEFYYSTFE